MEVLKKIKRNDWRSHSRRIYFSRAADDFRRELRKNTTTLIISAFGLVAALMWQDAIKAFINSFIPVSDPNNYIVKTFAAIVVTFISVVGIFLLSKIKGPE